MLCLLVILCLQEVIGAVAEIDQAVDSSIEQEKMEISHFHRENEHIRKFTNRMKEKCERTIRKLDQEYINLRRQIVEDLPQLKLVEEEITQEGLTKKNLIAETKKIKSYIQLLKLKKKVMIKDLELIELREGHDYEICKRYGNIIKFHPSSEELKPRSVSLRQLSYPNPDNPNTFFHQADKLLVDIDKERELAIHKELKQYIEYYSGHCKVMIAARKQLIQDLLRFPQHTLVSSLKNNLTEIHREVTKVRDKLNSLYNKVKDLAATINELQNLYDRHQNEVTCFVKLDQWNIQELMRTIEENTSSTHGRHDGIFPSVFQAKPLSPTMNEIVLASKPTTTKGPRTTKVHTELDLSTGKMKNGTLYPTTIGDTLKHTPSHTTMKTLGEIISTTRPNITNENEQGQSTEHPKLGLVNP